MKHLSGLDATFLHLETPEMPMHVGSLSLLDLPPGFEGDFYERLKAHIASRMHLAEVFTRKLALMPFELSNPVWVEDEDIDIDYHVRRVTLPKPGTFQQLEAYAARLHSTLLDRSRPMWEMFVFDGLKSGQVALYSKVHHAGVDGQAGVALANAIFDVTPEPRAVRPPRARARTNQYQLGVAELAGAAMRNTLAQYVKLVKTFPDMARAMQSLVVPQPGEDGKRQWPALKSFRLLGPRTPLNVAITNQRAYAARSVPLAEAKAIAKRFEVSLNDVVLACCAGALRKYLSEGDGLPKKPMTAAVPVSLRAQGDTESNNQVSMSVMTLATDVKDPLERLRVIHESSSAAKALMGGIKAALPTDFPSFGAPWLMTGLASLYGRSRISNTLPPVANVAISNVPGPQAPLYVAGARMATYFPVSIPSHGVALNITVQSYNGSLDYGLIACRRALPDIADLADYLLAEHRKLLALARLEETPEAAVAAPSATAATAKPPRAARKKAAAKPRVTPAKPRVTPARKARAANAAPLP